MPASVTPSQLEHGFQVGFRIWGLGLRMAHHMPGFRHSQQQPEGVEPEHSLQAEGEELPEE